jgi:dipeptidyl aminopeptidase/acylaminoacyl peptidase
MIAGLRTALCYTVMLCLPALGQSKESTCPPPVAMPSTKAVAARSVTTKDLLNLRDIHGIQISPNGKYVAFVVGQAVLETNDYCTDLFVVGTDEGSKATSLGTAGSPHWGEGTWLADPPQWSADSRYIYYSRKDTGTWQVWRWNREGGKPVQITHTKNDVKSFEIVTNGDKLVLVVDQPFNPEVRKQLAEHGVRYDGSIYAWESRAILDEVADAKAEGPETWIHDLSDNDEHKATEAELKEYSKGDDELDEKRFIAHKGIEGHHIMSVKLSPDGESIAYQRFMDDGQSGRESYPLYSKPLHGGTPVALAPDVYYIDQYWWGANSKEIYYTEYAGDGHPFKLMAIAATGGTPRQLLDTTDWVDQFSADRTARFLACSRENNTASPKVALVDTVTGAIQTLVDVNPELQKLRLSPAKRIEVSTKQGDSFFGHLVLPLDYEPAKRYPLIMTLYRDGDWFLRGAMGDEYPIQVFAANGFAVLDFDVGITLTEKHGHFDKAILRWESVTQGMEAAVSKLSEMGIVDRSKVAVTGLSYGVELVEYAISHTNLFHAAIASGSGSRDPYFFYMAGDEWHKHFAEWGLGGWPEGQASPNWHRLAPSLNADHIHAPYLVNVSDTEFLSALSLVTSLDQLGKPVELYIYPNEAHVKNQPKHRDEIYRRNLDWLMFWLKGEEDPDPAKAEQYARWRELQRRDSPAKKSSE